MLKALWVVITVAKLCWDAHYFEGYDQSLPLNVEVRSEEDREGYHRVYFTYQGLEGIQAPALLALPLEGEGPFPAVVFVHGVGQKKDFLDEIAAPFTRGGLAISTFDQHTTGERKLKDANWLEQAGAMRDRGSMTITETRRMVDYLQSRPDIAKDRIYLIGASYGAITGATAAAFDKRFRAVCLVYGGGDLSKLMGSDEVRKAIGPLVWPAAQLAEWFGAIMDPVRYVHGISPRPVFFMNGDRDRIVVPAAAQALYDAAREPKEIKWYPSDHLDLDPKYIPIAVNDGVEWFKAQDAKIVAESAAQ